MPAFQTMCSETTFPPRDRMTQSLHLPAPTPGPPTPGLRASAPRENWSLQLNSHRKHFFFFLFLFFQKKKGLRLKILRLAVLQADRAPRGLLPPISLGGGSHSGKTLPLLSPGLAAARATRSNQGPSNVAGGAHGSAAEGRPTESTGLPLDRTSMEAGGRRVTALKTAGAR